jgi:cell fate (sporulation/competence/biofilm development) regulator YlbF (YheA/YmcA/DUF963 family)
MVLRKELQELAQALKATQEYADMAGQRRKIMRDPSLGRQMQSFEREHTRILNLELGEQEVVTRLEKLYAQYKGFLEHQDVRTYIKSTESYQKMVAENI